LEGDTIKNFFFDSVEGEVVHFFEYEDFEHQNDIKGWSSAVGGVVVFSHFVEDWAEHFPFDESVEFGQEAVEFVDFFEAIGVIEEAVLSFAFGHGR
jgi:hypothetical protein